MLNLLQISLTTMCNFSCWHCPVTKWRNVKPEFPMSNSELIPFLEKYVDPQEWVVELTGGEPSLYEGIEELMEWLSAKGYYTLVKTNGSGNLPKLPNVKIVSAFHRLEEPPKNYDEYLIIDKVQREEKESYCKERGIPYKVVGYNFENPDGATHGFATFAFVNPDGRNPGCQGCRIEAEIVGDCDVNRITERSFSSRTCCQSCKAAIDAWRFLPEDIKKRRFKQRMRG